MGNAIPATETKTKRRYKNIFQISDLILTPFVKNRLIFPDKIEQHIGCCCDYYVVTNNNS
jgi:hypothetical protein